MARSRDHWYGRYVPVRRYAGEYAGLLAIREYHRSRGDDKRCRRTRHITTP